MFQKIQGNVGEGSGVSKFQFILWNLACFLWHFAVELLQNSGKKQLFWRKYFLHYYLQLILSTFCFCFPCFVFYVGVLHSYCTLILHSFFYKQLGSGFSPQSCLYFPSFRGSKLLNGCLVFWPSKLCVRGIQKFTEYKIYIYELSNFLEFW